MVTDKRYRTILLTVIAAALCVRVLFAVLTPAWFSADEYPHFWYAEQIARETSLPESRPVFPAYESYQPPLYYVAAALMVKLSPEMSVYSEEMNAPGTQLLILRLLSVLMGMVTILLMVRILDRLPDLTPADKLCGVAFVAFLPTYVGITSTVSNDAAVILLSTVSLYYCLHAQWTRRVAFLCGLWAGLALLTKMNAAILLPVIILRAWQVADRERSIAGRWVLIALGGWIIGAVVLTARNLIMYDGLLAINPGLPQEWTVSIPEVWGAVRNLTWSFWLAFGRLYRVTPAPIVYIVTAFPLMALAVLGWIRIYKRQFSLFALLGIGIGVAIAASLWYTLAYPPRVMTSWGKNLYPVLPLIAVFCVLGWRAISGRFSAAVPVVASVVLLTGCVWGLIRLAAL
ncbi:MAG: glycosyltransferase family 39 protein [Candidatus Zixiibacteriota bacterium]|nr:MAG: glycosyltransferase family 39 protein [candidate division Zixibacteria bacterium]